MKKKFAYKVGKRRLFDKKKYPVNNRRTRRHFYEWKKVGKNQLEDIANEKKVAYHIITKN